MGNICKCEFLQKVKLIEKAVNGTVQTTINDVAT